MKHVYLIFFLFTSNTFLYSSTNDLNLKKEIYSLNMKNPMASLPLASNIKSFSRQIDKSQLNNATKQFFIYLGTNKDEEFNKSKRLIDQLLDEGAKVRMSDIQNLLQTATRVKDDHLSIYKEVLSDLIHHHSVTPDMLISDKYSVFEFMLENTVLKEAYEVISQRNDIDVNFEGGRTKNILYYCSSNIKKCKFIRQFFKYFSERIDINFKSKHSTRPNILFEIADQIQQDKSRFNPQMNYTEFVHSIFTYFYQEPSSSNGKIDVNTLHDELRVPFTFIYKVHGYNFLVNMIEKKFSIHIDEKAFIRWNYEREIKVLTDFWNDLF
ncbi:MAG: hypothetical protein H6622_15385 [Halobacteriovoraceae bacterium]|nr:hypothetical protein [Halobacteriovoraceae bacterium]